jgi:hypothetical protein
MAGSNYACTPEGVGRFPGLKIVSHYSRDGMPIYRRWVDGGIATEEACPYCLGREGDIMKNQELGPQLGTTEDKRGLESN